MSSPYRLAKPLGMEHFIADFELDLLREVVSLPANALISFLRSTGADSLAQSAEDITTRALIAFVQRWRYNRPTIEHFFHLVCSLQPGTHIEHTELNHALAVSDYDGVGPISQNKAFMDAFYEAQNRKATTEFGIASCSGIIFVTLWSILDKLHRDVTVTRKEKWTKNIGKTTDGYFLGSIIESASNNFRHHEEWASVSWPDQRQLPSIQCLATIMEKPYPVINTSQSNSGIHWLRHNVCPEILLKVFEDDFRICETHVFQYVKAIAEWRCEKLL